MTRFAFVVASLLSLFFFAWSGSGGTSFAQEKNDMKGWEEGSPYNKLYDPSEWDKLKGIVLDFKEVIPMPGMAPGLALVVKDREDEIVMIHLGPKSFIDSQNIGVRKGEDITAKGVWVEIDGQDIFIASKIKKGEYAEYKIRRTKDGKPYWTMSPKELAGEQTGQ